MRHLLLVLMIALLPVRGWAVDVMALSMAAGQLNAIETIATEAINTGEKSQFYSESQASMPTDCPMQIQAPDNTSAGVCHGCNTCLLCMAVVTGYPMTLAGAASLPQAEQAFGSASFTSAERAPGFKPPIS